MASKLTRDDLVDFLHKASAPSDKSGQVAEQIRYTLALSQLTNQKPMRPAPPRPHPPGTARVVSLVRLGKVLNGFQVSQLYREIDRIQDVNLRFDLLSQIAPYMAQSEQRDVVQNLWRNVREIMYADVRASVLYRLFPLVDAIHNTPPTSFMAVFDIAHNIENLESRTRSLIALSRYVAPDLALSIQRSVIDAIEQTHSDKIRTNALISLAENLASELVERALDCALDIEAPDARVRALTVLARHIPETYTRRVQAAALDAIEGIMGEEARVEALIAFAPYMEDYVQDWRVFPEMLERALAIAVNMPRRQFRAKALVALAPHLPPELQGEALAAVHSLPSERDRATMLGQLALELPPNMLVASLAVAHTMEELDSRVYALTHLALRVPEQAREQTIRDALQEALAFPRPFERINAVVELLPMLPANLKQSAYDQLLKASETIKNDHTRARALIMIGSNLPEERVPEALAIVERLEDPQQKLSALAGLVDHLQDPRRKLVFEDMLVLVKEIRYEYRQARALLSIASILPQNLIPAALGIAHTLQDPYDQVSVLIALAQNSHSDQRPELVAEAWRLLRLVENGYDRANGLASIAPLLPHDAEQDLAHAVGMAIGSIMDEYDQASAIILLAPLLATGKSQTVGSSLPSKIQVLQDGLRAALRVPNQPEKIQLLREGIALWLEAVPLKEREVHNALWADLLPRIGELPLADAILCVGELCPLVMALGGENAARELAVTMGLAKGS